jgi:hypothetical protein
VVALHSRDEGEHDGELRQSGRSAVSDITVVPFGDPGAAGDYRVQLHESEDRTDHHVRVEGEILDELGIWGLDPSELVRESMSYLLERELPVGIPHELSLAQLSRQHDDYMLEMRTRLA